MPRPPPVKPPTLRHGRVPRIPLTTVGRSTGSGGRAHPCPWCCRPRTRAVPLSPRGPARRRAPSAGPCCPAAGCRRAGMRPDAGPVRAEEDPVSPEEDPVSPEEDPVRSEEGAPAPGNHRAAGVDQNLFVRQSSRCPRRSANRPGCVPLVGSRVLIDAGASLALVSYRQCGRCTHRGQGRALGTRTQVPVPARGRSAAGSAGPVAQRGRVVDADPAPLTLDPAEAAQCPHALHHGLPRVHPKPRARSVPSGAPPRARRPRSCRTARRAR